MTEHYRAVKAEIHDAQAIHDLVNLYAQRGDMLPRTMGEVYENLRDFFVVRDPSSLRQGPRQGRPLEAGALSEGDSPGRGLATGQAGAGQRGQFLGCVALHIVWADLAEIKSLAVPENVQARGIGSLLVRAAVEEARSVGLERVFALTYRPAFFERLGFVQADVMTLPRKVWNECYRCPKFPSCNEIAVILDL